MRRFVAIPLAGCALATAVLGAAPLAQADGMPGSGKTVTVSTVLNPVPTNHVHGSGTASITLTGLQATVRVDAWGLVPNAPHAMHIHVDAMGQCPTAAMAKLHNGHRSIDVMDAASAYGAIGTSLTTTGDTSPASGLAITRFPVGSTIHYKRTITVSSDVAANIRDHKAVIVVHGIDYDGSGKYTNVLGPSELDPSLPMTATDPALCGVPAPQPSGAVAAGQGGTQQQPMNTTLYAAAAALLAGSAGAFALRRRKADRS